MALFSLGLRWNLLRAASRMKLKILKFERGTKSARFFASWGWGGAVDVLYLVWLISFIGGGREGGEPRGLVLSQ